MFKKMLLQLIKIIAKLYYKVINYVLLILMGIKLLILKMWMKPILSKGKSLGLTGKEVESKQIHNEAIVFSNFTKQNSINVRSEIVMVMTQ